MDTRLLPRPDLERLWTEEVLYLHSLWRRGPPANRNRNPKTGPALLHAAPAAFKKKPKRGANEKGAPSPPDEAGTFNPSPAAAEQEWPSSASWADLAPPPPADRRLPASTEEQARLATAQAQYNGLKASRDFFSKDGGSDDEEEEEEEDDAMDEMDGAKMGPFKFFMELFVKDGELRKYYEKNYEKGEFSCLVCAGTRFKSVRKFQDCVGLVQHANSISKTKRRVSHRALSRAVCQVLGWDISRLPSFVLDMGDTLGQSLSKAAKTQKEDVTENKEDLHEDIT